MKSVFTSHHSHRNILAKAISSVIVLLIAASALTLVSSIHIIQPAFAESYHSAIPDTGQATIVSQHLERISWVAERAQGTPAGTYAPTVRVNGVDYEGGCYQAWSGDPTHSQYGGPCNGTADYWYVTTIGSWAYYCLDTSDFGLNQWSAAGGPWPKGTQQTVFRVPALGYLKVQKSSGNTNFTNNNSRYSLSGAEYGVYRDSGTTDLAATLTTESNGQSDIVALTPGTYYVKETKASKGYKLDSTVHSVSVTSGNTTSEPAVVNSTEQPQTGKIKIEKKSSASWSTSYATYSFEGATYEVRDQNGKLWATLVTNVYGTITSSDLPLNLYTIKETIAPKGYHVNITPFNLDISTDGDLKIGESIDRPGVHTDSPFAAKKDFNHNADNTGYNPQGTAKLTNAVYELSYYDGYYENLSQLSSITPKRVTTMTTEMLDNKAIINATYNEADVSKSNMLYDGTSWGLPLGTYKLKEITAPEGYQKDPFEYIVWCQPDTSANGHLYAKDSSTVETNKAAEISTSNRLILSDMVSRGDFSLMKYIETTTDTDQYPDKKRPVAGVQFEIINDNDYDVLNVETGKWIKKGEVVYTLTTDDQGYASTYRQQTDKGLTGVINNNNQTGQAPGSLAYGSYIVREVPETTPQGYVPIENYHFSISANHQQHHQVFENKTGTVVRVNKTDAGTHLNVRGATKFRILDSNKNVITFDEPYPSNGKYSILTTSIDGSVILPEKLMMGTYYIQEVEAPEGYIYTDKLVSFNVDSSTVNTYDNPLDIEFPNVPAKGKIVITKTDSETDRTIVDASAKYNVYAAEDIVTEDGTIRAKKDDNVATIITENGIGESSELFLGKYYVQETAAPEGYLIDTTRHDVEIKYAGDRTPVVNEPVSLSDEAVKGTIQAKKVDSVSKTSIKSNGAVFEIRAAENIIGKDKNVWYTKGETVDTIRTDDEGIASSSKMLPLGRYELVEIQAPYGYVLDSTPVPVELAYADQNTPVVSVLGTKSDLASRGDFDVAKLDRETGKNVFTPGCEIDIYADEEIKTLDGSVRYHKDEWVGSVKTDETGAVKSDLNLYVGKYRLQEKNAPAGYVLDSERQYQVEIPWDGGANEHNIYEASISDMPSKGIISFTKVDAETGKAVPVEGIKANVYADEDITTGDNTIRYHKDDLVAELTTDANGVARTGELYLGNYRVIETFAPEGYLLNENPVNVELVYAGQDIAVITQSTQIADDNAKGIIEIVKIDKETGKTVSLADTTFEIRAKTDIITGDGTVRAHAGDIVDTVVTDDTGKGRTKELYLGIYQVIETKAPHGYTLDDTPHDAIIAYKDQHTAIVLSTESIANTVQKGVISVTKVDAESGLSILSAGAEFEVTATKDIITPDGTTRVHKGDVVDVIETDETGVASTKALYLGEYEVRETKAPHGYLLSDEVKTVILSYGDQTAPLVYEMTGIADTSAKGIITVHKEDSDLEEPLSSVEYEIRADENIVTADGITHYKEGDIVETIVTDDSGIAQSSELYLGEYVVTETVQPNGYELDEKEYPVHLVYDGQEMPIVHEGITLYNTPTSLTVKKVSTTDMSTVVPGTKFVGWSAADEMDTQATFTVFADDSAEIQSANVVYYGELSQGISRTEEKQFSLESNIDDTDKYQVAFSDEELLQGNYVLSISYSISGEDKTEEIPFVVNEYDSNAFFAIGTSLIKGGNDSNSFLQKSSLTMIDDAETDEYENENVDSDEAIDTDDIPADVLENADELEDAPSHVKRVPVVLSQGFFAYAETDESGLATFTYVPQGAIGVAEYEPAEGYVSDRTPGYIDVNEIGRASKDSSDYGNILPTERDDEGNITTHMSFADDQTKLHISKRDITTSEELPGNTLSVYEYVENNKKSSEDIDTDEIDDTNYGRLVETWVSTNEPHYMELLPQGTYILKEEQAVDGFTVAESIIFKLNDTGVEQQVVMNNEHVAEVADELIELVETNGKQLSLLFATIGIAAMLSGIYLIKRKKRF